MAHFIYFSVLMKRPCVCSKGTVKTFDQIVNNARRIKDGKTRNKKKNVLVYSQALLITI